MQKDQTYYESAIAYNEGLAEFAENLVPTLEHEEVKRWCTAVGKQHRFHAKRHRAALVKLLSKQEAQPVEIMLDGLDVPPLAEPNVVDGGEVVMQMAVTNPITTGGVDADVTTKVTDSVLSDGCIQFHYPANKNCQFHPATPDGGSSVES